MVGWSGGWVGWLGWVVGLSGWVGWLGWVVGLCGWVGWLGWVVGLGGWVGWLGWVVGLGGWVVGLDGEAGEAKFASNGYPDSLMIEWIGPKKKSVVSCWFPFFDQPQMVSSKNTCCRIVKLRGPLLVSLSKKGPT